MFIHTKTFLLGLSVIIGLGLASACDSQLPSPNSNVSVTGADDDDPDEPKADSYQLIVRVDDLADSQEVAVRNGDQEITFITSGQFAFLEKLATGTAYNVIIKTQPTTQTCFVVGGQGTVANATIIVDVFCEYNIKIKVGGVTSLLFDDGLMLRNGSDSTVTETGGDFFFSQHIFDGDDYDIIVTTNPTAKSCSLIDGVGTAEDDASHQVQVTLVCDDLYSIGGTVNGLTATSLIVEIDGDELTINASGGFTFPTYRADSYNYTATINSQPPGSLQFCKITNETGTISAANITNITVDCFDLLKAIEPGDDLVCAITTADNVLCWDQTGVANATELDLPGSPGISQLTVGYEHGCALTNDSDVYCWGSNGVGQLGLGNATDVDFTTSLTTKTEVLSATEISVDGITVTGIHATNGKTCALLSNGKLRCWGLNAFGHLGYGVYNGSPGSLFGDNLCSLGDTLCFGDDDESGGEHPKDFGSIVFSDASQSDLVLGANIQSLGGSVSHSCGILTDGTVRCWGNNQFGQLGYPLTESATFNCSGSSTDNDCVGDNETPVSQGDVAVLSAAEIAGSYTVLAIGAGQNHSCALISDGTNNFIRCWGYAGVGHLGYGTTSGDNLGDEALEMPTANLALSGNPIGLSMGQQHSCALLDSNQVQCWGRNNEGQLGLGGTQFIGDTETPDGGSSIAEVLTSPEDDGVTIDYLSTGIHTTCVVLSTGFARCWGESGANGYSHSDNIGDDSNEFPHGQGGSGSTAGDIIHF